MTEKLGLPEGITLNNLKDDDTELDLDSTIENIDSIQCNFCNISFESLLITSFGRHEGVVRIMPSDTDVWKNPLPKDRNKSIKMLKDTLILKIDKHKERHNND
jgi:hypothetical protein